MAGASKNPAVPYALLFWVVIGLVLGVVYFWSSSSSKDNPDVTPATTNVQSTDSSGCNYEGCAEDEVERQQYEDYKAEKLQDSEAKTTCVDVTSYDYNWDNDVKCTNPDGTTFYTNYAGGRRYGL